MLKGEQPLHPMILILSCEHGGNKVPSKFKKLFQGHETLLNSHKGYDPGTEDLFDYLLPMADFGIKNTTSRLLIEFNRSDWSQQLFSPMVKGLSKEDKEGLLKNHYRPYREKLAKVISDNIEENRLILHLSLHSFTPQLGTQKRNNDFGILYDPTRTKEKYWAKSFKERIEENLGAYRVRMNYPYLGKADGLTSYFRKKFSEHYLGIELEINQKWANENKFPKLMKEQLKHCIEETLSDF